MLQIQNISKSFSTGANQSLLVLDQIHLRVDEGEFVCLLGPSGCGKTTLLRIITGLEQPDQGTIILDGKSKFQPGKDVCMVFQSYGLFPWLTVIENIAWGLKIQGIKKAERLQAAREQIERIGLKGFEHHYPHQISGGMQQRVGLARALTNTPKVLLMDEPFAAVDAQTRETLQDELLRLRSQSGCTVLFVTHSIEEAVYLSDRAVIMSRNPGRIARIIPIDLPQPRWQKNVRLSTRYAELVIELRRFFGEGLSDERSHSGSEKGCSSADVAG